MSNRDREFESDILEEDDTHIQAPRSYHVILHNDDYTTMEFVQEVLEVIFHHSPAAAANLMLLVHRQGKAVAGTFTRDIAETKAAETILRAREEGYPLKCSVEPS